MTVKNYDKYLEINVVGDVDVINCEKFKDDVLKTYNKDKKDVIFDCSNLTFVDSTGLGAFVAINNALKKDNNKITLKNVISRIYKLFKITGLEAELNVVEVK